MGRENKKDVVAALHREQIMKAAEKLFSEKGYVQTTIDDISKRYGDFSSLFLIIRFKIPF